jgi:hypothetical protein
MRGPIELTSRPTIDLLLKARWPLLVAALLAAALAMPASQRMDFDRSIENMFASDDPLLATYRKLKRTFGGNEIVMVVYSDPSLFAEDGSGLDRLGAISQRCETVPGVAGVLSIERLIGRQIVERDNPIAGRVRSLFENYSHATDGETAAVICMLVPADRTNVGRDSTVEGLRQIAGSLPPDLSPGVLAGEPVMVVEGFNYLEQDGRRLGLWSTLLLSITIVVCFRSWRWVVVPIIVVQWTLLMTRATLVCTGIRLSMVSSMLTAIVTVVGVATVVHVIIRFREARAAGQPPYEALSRASRLVAAPVFLACVTDAVGFLSLTVSQVGPVQDFGVMMSIGSLLVIPAVACLLPVPILWHNAGGHFETTASEQRISRLLEAALRIVERRRIAILCVLGLAVGVSIVGLSRLEIETDFTKNFRRDSPVVEAYQVVEGRLGGAGVLDLMLPAPEKLDWSYLERVLLLEQELRERFPTGFTDGRATSGLTKVLSLADAVSEGSPIDPSNSPQLLRDGIVQAALVTIRGQLPVFAGALYGEDPNLPGQHYLRVMLRAPEQQSSQDKLRLINGIQALAQKHFPPTTTNETAAVTGFFVLLANLVESILRDQWKAFGVAILGIGLMMILAFRSPQLALITLIPNALPVVLVLGGMGWFGGRVNMGVAMIAAVSLGLSVDSSIHYVTFFKRARDAGKSVAAAISEVQRTVGRAVIFSTLALIVGFTVLCASDFVPTVYFGLLVSLSMLGGLLGNLFLLPMLLRIASTRESVGA